MLNKRNMKKLILITICILTLNPLFAQIEIDLEDTVWEYQEDSEIFRVWFFYNTELESIVGNYEKVRINQSGIEVVLYTSACPECVGVIPEKYHPYSLTFIGSHKYGEGFTGGQIQDVVAENPFSGRFKLELLEEDCTGCATQMNWTLNYGMVASEGDRVFAIPTNLILTKVE